MISKENFIVEIKNLSTVEQKLIFTQKYFFSGLPFLFNNDEIGYFDFKNRVSNHFKVNHYDIFIVGSSKLGFSPYKLTDFNYNSDVDVVIANEKLFDYFFKIVCDYQYLLKNNEIRLDRIQMKSYEKFLKYFVMGWMRPDLIPTNSTDFKKIRSEWDNFFHSISYSKSEAGNYKIKGGLFKNMSFAETYYLTTIREIQSKNI